MAELKKSFDDWWNHEGKSFDLDWYQKRLTLGAKAFEAGWKAALATAIAGSVRETAVSAAPERAIHPRPQRLEQHGPGMKPRGERR